MITSKAGEDAEDLDHLHTASGNVKWNVAIKQWSPTFLAPGTDFVEDNFSMIWLGGWLYSLPPDAA